MNGNANALLEDLLYGRFDFENDAHRRFRIVRTFYGVQLIFGSIFDYDNSLIHPNQFAPFWTLVQSDLNYYFWFLFLPFSKYFMEGSFGDWVADEFRNLVQGAQMAGKLKKYWPSISKKLIEAGILEPAIIHREGVLIYLAITSTPSTQS